MANFQATVTVKLELSTAVDVTAKDEEAATAKVQKMIDDGKFNVFWTPPKESKDDWEETDQQAEIDAVEEV